MAKNPSTQNRPRTIQRMGPARLKSDPTSHPMTRTMRSAGAPNVKILSFGILGAAMVAGASVAMRVTE